MNFPKISFLSACLLTTLFQIPALATGEVNVEHSNGEINSYSNVSIFNAPKVLYFKSTSHRRSWERLNSWDFYQDSTRKLGPPRRALRAMSAIRDQEPNQNQAESNQNRAKSKASQIQIQSQSQIRARSP